VAAVTPMCQVNTGSVMMPSGGSGKCYCDIANDADIMGYCSPDPLDEGYENTDCRGSVDYTDAERAHDPEGKCQYYCMCGDAIASHDASRISCCIRGPEMYLADGVVESAVEAAGATEDTTAEFVGEAAMRAEVPSQVVEAATPTCQAGTGSAVMPSGGSGKCYCDTANDADIMGYCSPDPIDEGYDNKDCRGSLDHSDAERASDPEGKCQYYCQCADAIASRDASRITCCSPGSTMYLEGGVIKNKEATFFP